MLRFNSMKFDVVLFYTVYSLSVFQCKGTRERKTKQSWREVQRVICVTLQFIFAGVQFSRTHFFCVQ